MKSYLITSAFCSTLAFLAGSLCSAVYANDDNFLNDGNIEWDLGLGGGIFNYQLYPGAVSSNTLVIPVPYFTFRSPRLEIDRGIKGFLYSSERFALDVSADFALPADSEDTRARQGMPDLDFMVQLGPSLEFLLNDAARNYFDVRFEIPVRAAFATDLSDVKNSGYLLEPRFSFNHRRLAKTGLTQKVTLGLKFATEDYHDYYYQVAPVFANATRPAYDSDSGFGGSFINYYVSYKTSDFVYWMFFRYQSLRGAVFEDSPLVEQKDYYFAGFGFAWLFAGSY